MAEVPEHSGMVTRGCHRRAASDPLDLMPSLRAEYANWQAGPPKRSRDDDELLWDVESRSDEELEHESSRRVRLRESKKMGEEVDMWTVEEDLAILRGSC